MSSKKCQALQEQFVSNGRLKGYRNYKEYLENIKLSKDFYIPLSIIEISFRNSLNIFLNQKIGDNWHYRNDILQADAQRSIQSSIQMLHQQNKQINHFIFTKLNSIRLFRNKVFRHDKIVTKQEYQNMMNEI